MASVKLMLIQGSERIHLKPLAPLRAGLANETALLFGAGITAGEPQHHQTLPNTRIVLVYCGIPIRSIRLVRLVAVKTSLSLTVKQRSTHIQAPWKMDFDSLKAQVSNLTLYDLKAGVRKVQNGMSMPGFE